MAVITDKQRVEISRQFDVMRYMFPARQYMEEEQFLSLYFDPEQKEIIRAAEELANPDSIHKVASINLGTHLLHVPDDIPYPEDCSRAVTVSFDCNPASERLYPRNLTRPRQGANKADCEKLLDMLNELLRIGIIHGFWTFLCEFYTERCSTHEQMRYLFPGTCYILRRAKFHGLDKIASGIDEIKRVPTLPLGIKPMERKIFRFMNEWFALQMLLDTFNAPSA